MDRRALLSTAAGAAATGLAGCLSSVGVGSPSNPVDDGPRRVALTGVDPLSDAAGLAVDVRVLDARITPAATAAVAVETTVRDGATELPVTKGPCAILNRRACASEPGGLWLESTDERHGTDGPTETETPADGWVKRDLPTGAQGFGGYGCRRVAYEQGETIRNTYAVWDDGRVDGYLEPGEYRWAGDISVRAASSDSEEGFRSFDWGFSLALTRVEGG